jgi:hypothetical protein
MERFLYIRNGVFKKTCQDTALGIRYILDVCDVKKKQKTKKQKKTQQREIATKSVYWASE